MTNKTQIGKPSIENAHTHVFAKPFEIYRITVDNQNAAVIATKNREQAIAFAQGRFGSDVDVELIDPQMALNVGMVGELWVDPKLITLR